jgi:hypothetical protein
MNFIFLNGGMGDYITWLQPIRWLASEATWIKGTLVAPNYLQELAKYFLRDAPEWTVTNYEAIKDQNAMNSRPYRGPVVLQQESLNATGAHLLTCGWVYFTNKEKAPPGWDSYPQLNQTDLDNVPMDGVFEGKNPLQPGRYAVVTTGVTTSSRKIPGAHWNHVIDHIVAQGLQPVFLGKDVVETGNARNIHTQFNTDIKYSAGLDLRNKTSLMQAASIMSRAAFVIGHDNGLLHLAGCTEVPIIFGYNLASPEHREPRRPKGRTYNVTLTNEELACNHCQSRTNFVIGYNFRECFYGDLKCIDLLFADGALRWRKAIDQAVADNARAKNRFDL